METDHALAIGCDRVEQSLAHRRGTLGTMMVGSGHPVGMRKRENLRRIAFMTMIPNAARKASSEDRFSSMPPSSPQQ